MLFPARKCIGHGLFVIERTTRDGEKTYYSAGIWGFGWEQSGAYSQQEAEAIVIQRKKRYGRVNVTYAIRPIDAMTSDSPPVKPEAPPADPGRSDQTPR